MGKVTADYIRLITRSIHKVDQRAVSSCKQRLCTQSWALILPGQRNDKTRLVIHQMLMNGWLVQQRATGTEGSPKSIEALPRPRLGEAY